MSLVHKIQSECEAHGLEFLYDNGNGLNQLINNADLSDDKTVCCLFAISTSTFSEGKETANLVLCFFKQTELDFEAVENEEIQERCKEDAFNFIRRIERGNKLVMNGEITLTRYYDEFDQNVTGVAISASVSETVGLEDCFDDYRKRFDPYCGG